MTVESSIEKKITIRPFQVKDCQALSSLYDQLGYPVDSKTLHHRLTKLLLHDDYHLLIAVVDGQPAGFVGFARMYMFEADEGYIRILALVVDEHFRRQGIATSLLEGVKKFAIENEIKALVLNSGISTERSGAHTFYESTGFLKTSFGYKCSL